MAAWRGEEENPFHTEVGYWLWDAAEGHVMRCFMVPRGTLVLAGGPATADATTFSMAAEVGSETYGILSNRFLAEAARTTRYEVTITIGDGIGGRSVVTGVASEGDLLVGPRRDIAGDKVGARVVTPAAVPSRSEITDTEVRRIHS